MSNAEIFKDNLLIARISNLEYENYTAKGIEEEIRRIYFEVMGTEVPAEIKAYTSDDILKERRDLE